MADAECPYCSAAVEINHDDGYGYSENETYTQECHACGKTFVFTTCISFDYETFEAPCQNGGEHAWVPVKGHPPEAYQYKKRCSYCSEEIITDQAAYDAAWNVYLDSFKNRPPPTKNCPPFEKISTPDKKEI